jgi:hypothetical protein
LAYIICFQVENLIAFSESLALTTMKYFSKIEFLLSMLTDTKIYSPSFTVLKDVTKFVGLKMIIKEKFEEDMLCNIASLINFV